ncbi:uncharacterized protein K02A2.6-like isoform X1 [Drosophila eugracilis]|uniref:uncharacterized protein K02A2.6-like isoform X1 n=1 Tax=Drosophila eugracilis TaxID=29029 RepID=UPI001BDA7596|nr:uncharacterized protein K02A2.6-like isoform X1 [Drosophila eugracilis]
MPYDPSLPLLLATDASSTGIGAVLSHRLTNGNERPIAYASRTLSQAELKYSPIDKEALAIVWATQRFFKYLYARHWTLITDNKPLAQILHPGKSLPTLCISRMANYADFMSNFDFDSITKKSKENSNADYLSRLPIKAGVIKEVEDSSSLDEFDNFMIRQIKQLPVTAKGISQETRKDQHLGKILQLLENGQCLAKNGYKSPECIYGLSYGCLTFEHRIVIPTKLRQTILDELHRAHLGVVKMKGIARSFVYWPGIDKDIENTGKACESCAKNAKLPPKCSDHYWEYPKTPWERIHIDYAGPIHSMMLLIITDAYSKWLEVKVTKTITAGATIAILDELFATYGVPLMLVTDNGTNFTSKEFKNYLTSAGIRYHKLTAPYHPATNGQAERNVQIVKQALKAMRTSSDTMRRDLNEFLQQYRNAPHCTTGEPPAKLFLGRKLRTRLDLIRPENVTEKVSAKRVMNFNPSYRQFHSHDEVYFLSGNPRMDKWVQGKITKRLGDLHYEILYNGKLFKRHINQMRGCISQGAKGFIRERESKLLEYSSEDKDAVSGSSSDTVHRDIESTTNEEDNDDIFSTPITSPSLDHRDALEQTQQAPQMDSSTPQVQVDTKPTLRRSSRIRQPRIIFSSSP